MKDALLVLQRDMWSRRMALVAAAVAGLVPLAVAMLPAARGNASEARVLLASFIAYAMAGGVAVMTGSGLVAPDLLNRRLGFYLARPLGASSLWTGKLVAAILLALAAGILALLPVALVDGIFPALFGGSFQVDNGLLQDMPPIPWVVVIVAGVVTLVLLSHAVSVALRSRSPWVLFDVVALPLVLLVAWAGIRRLVEGAALALAAMAIVTLAIAALAALAIAGWAQLENGRSSVRRAHRAQSLALWGVLGLTVAGFDAGTRWVAAVEPEDLVDLQIQAANPTGTWVWLWGEGRGRGDYQAGFWMNTATGAGIRVPPWANQTVSADGSTAVWIAPQNVLDPGRTNVWTLALKEGAKPVELDLTLPQWTAMALSADGSRLAAIDGTTLGVYDTASGDTLAAARTGEYDRDRLTFAGPGVVRHYGIDDKGVTIHALDVAAKRVARTGMFQWSTPEQHIFSLAGDNLMTLGVKTAGAELRDPASGEIKAQILAPVVPGTVVAGGAQHAKGWADLLADGSVVTTQPDGDGVRVHFLAPDGSERHVVRAAGVRFRRFIAQLPDGRLLAMSPSGPGSDRQARQLVEIDPQTGAVSSRAKGVFAAAWIARWTNDPASAAVPRGEIATLFLDRGQLARYDPKTGAMTPIALQHR